MNMQHSVWGNARSLKQGGTRHFGFRAPKPQTYMDQRFEAANRNPYVTAERESKIDHMAKGQMYTPEAMQTEKFTQHLNKMVNFGYEEPSLLDRYGDRAAALAQGFKGKEIGIVLNCFARTRHQHAGLLDAFARSIPPKLGHFDPKALSLTCNAYAKFKSWRNDNPKTVKKLFRRLGQEIPHKLPLFEPQHIANVALAFAKLEIDDALLFDDLCDEFLRHPEDFSAVELIMLTRAFSAQQPNTSSSSSSSTTPAWSDRRIQLWDTLCHWLLEARMDLCPDRMVTILNCLSKVDHGHKALIDTFATDLSAQATTLSVLSCSLIINSFGRLRHYDEALFAAVAQRLVVLFNSADTTLNATDNGQSKDGSSSSTEPYLLCAIVHSYGKLLQPMPENLFLAIAAQVRQHGDALSPQALTNLCHGMARLQLKDPQLLAYVAKQIAKKATLFTPDALCVILYSYARLKVRSEMLVYLLSQQLVTPQRLPKLSGQGVGMILYALAKFKIEDDRLINGCKKQARILGPTLNEVEVCMITHALAQLGRMDDQLASVLNSRLEDLESPPDREDDWWANWSPDIDNMATSASTSKPSSEGPAFHRGSPFHSSTPYSGSPFDSDSTSSSGPSHIHFAEDSASEFHRDDYQGSPFVDSSSSTGPSHIHLAEDSASEVRAAEDDPESAQAGVRHDGDSSGGTFPSTSELSDEKGRRAKSAGSKGQSDKTSDDAAEGDAGIETKDRDDLWTMLEQSDASAPQSIKNHFRFTEAQKTRGRKTKKTRSQ
eukprot:GEMP01012046.1.p1 GENE.GEMP01012046.1~~GEMP01012046.1.p1  ORF type:complete len:772 (+),score=198.26 GEMP01012046.1:169-2484(+)